MAAVQITSTSSVTHTLDLLIPYELRTLRDFAQEFVLVFRLRHPGR